MILTFFFLQFYHRFAVGIPKPFGSYHYLSLKEKMEESFDKCDPASLILNSTLAVNYSYPSKDLKSYWMSIPPPITYISPAICTDDKKVFSKVGCGKGVGLHPDAPRCHRDKIKAICENFLNYDQPVILDDAKQSKNMSVEQLLHTSPYILSIKDGIVSKCGVVALPCGIFTTKTTCGAIRDVEASIVHTACFGANDLTTACQEYSMVKKVFVLSYKYDSAIGHFLTEVFPRIIYHMDFLNDPEMLIHYGCDKKFQKFNPPLRFLQVAFFSPRVQSIFKTAIPHKYESIKNSGLE